ncbi:uncharacterized protein LOC134178353 [Corticium candelabrum]|uniref:uncharacterized protein LOC134178353 n=1 Tax=Corticium candelabrum TaxID=121492 RepID=UPI002E271863|nr:uncharacterized protein LOC134178353 [Corticium candelabrum]
MASPFFALVVVCVLGKASCHNYWVEDCSPPFENVLRSDPCRPGGKWDELLKRCNGYFADSCYQCFSGELCEHKEDVQNCSLVAGVHNPISFDEYWSQLAGQPCSYIPAGFRMAYSYNDISSSKIMLSPLESALRELHSFVGNAETKGYIIFPSLGATQGVEAALSAISMSICEEHNVEKADVFAQAPYYSHFVWLANNSLQTARWNPNADPQAPTTIEIVTWPNNPDGRKLQPLQPDPKRRVYDLSFYWQTYTDIETMLNEEIMVFSGSKHSGLSASRGGWLLVKDPKFALGVSAYITNTTIGVPVDTQLRLLEHAKHILNSHTSDRKEDELPPFYDFMGNMTRQRFAELETLFMGNDEYELVNAKTMGGLAWIHCKKMGYSCPALFTEIGLQGNSGLHYGANDSYVRFSMALPDVEHAIFLEKIKIRLSTKQLTDKPPSHLKQQYNIIPGTRSFP